MKTGRARVPPLFPLSPSVCTPWRSLPRASHFLELMDAAVAQWRDEGLRGTRSSLSSDPPEVPDHRPAATGPLPQGWGHAVTPRHRGHPARSLRAPRVAGLCTLSRVEHPWPHYARLPPCWRVFLNQKRCFFRLPLKDSVLCHVLSHFCAVARLGNLLR